MSGRDASPAPLALDGELALAGRVGAGDRAAFGLLMGRHNRRLFRLARAVLRDPAEAEDAVQDAYLLAFRSIADFRGEATLATWLSRLVLNECLARLRRSSRRQSLLRIVSVDSEQEVEGVAADDAGRPDRVAGVAEMRTLLEYKLDQLPQSFRTVFVLRSVEELSIEETALALGIPEATVRSRHFRAKGLLRESLAQDIDLAERDVFDFGGAHCAHLTARVLARLADPGASALAGAEPPPLRD
jgi:RNA polymerase sigma factor (sigma-70 family)